MLNGDSNAEHAEIRREPQRILRCFRIQALQALSRGFPDPISEVGSQRDSSYEPLTCSQSIHSILVKTRLPRFRSFPVCIVAGLLSSRLVNARPTHKPSHSAPGVLHFLRLDPVCRFAATPQTVVILL